VHERKQSSVKLIRSSQQDKLIVDGGFVANLIRKILAEPDLEKLAKFVDENTDID
jgi:hypothetical protein